MCYLFVVQVEIKTIRQVSTHPESWLLQVFIKNPKPCAGNRCQQVDKQLEKELSGDLLFEQDVSGHISHIYFPKDDHANANIFKRGKATKGNAICRHHECYVTWLRPVTSTGHGTGSFSKWYSQIQQRRPTC